MNTDRVPVESSFPPFWMQYRKILLYPMHAWLLAFSTAIAAATALLPSFTISGWLMQHVVLWGLVLEYSFTVLKSSAQGRLHPPNVTSMTIMDDLEVVFKQFALFAVTAFLYFQIYAFAGVVVAVLFLGLAILVLPAMIIVLTVTGSLLRSLNPLLLARMARSMGRGYVRMSLFLMLLAVYPAPLALILLMLVPQSMSTFILTLGECYYTLLAYHLIGYVMLQYREETGWSPHRVSGT